MRGLSFLRRNALRFFCVGLLGLAGVAGFVAYANHITVRAGEGRIVEAPTELPENSIALVLGCSPVVGGRTNLFFEYRIDAAVELWESGRLRCLIVSGDNSRNGYNEPEDMREALVARGVPKERIVCDYAGLRTLDSIVRAKEIFGAEELVVVSQRFHNERALYLAQAHGIEARGYDARMVEGEKAKKTLRREFLARPKMWLDVHVLGTEPRHWGPQEVLPPVTP